MSISVGSKAILLYESDNEVIKDIVASLGLVGVSVTTVSNEAEALREIAKKTYALVLSRPSVSGSKGAAESLLNKQLGDPRMREVPHVLVCKAGEEQQLSGKGEGFAGVLKLPVEFPRFAEELSAFLSGGYVPWTKVVAKPKEEKNEAQSENDANSKLPWHHKNMLVVYALHDAVLAELRKMDRFESLPKEKIPELVHTITGSVVRQFANAGK